MCAVLYIAKYTSDGSGHLENESKIFLQIRQ